MTIQITDKIKIDFPKGELIEGPISEKPNLGVHQEKYFLKIQNILEKNGSELDYFWYGNFIFSDTNKKATNFVIKSSCGRLYWRKYEANVSGGCHNVIFFDGIKDKINDWIEKNK